MWARGREGQAWVVGCVCPARPHAPAWKGEGAVHTCVACPSSFCHTLTLLQSEATADPPPLPRLDVQACSFLAQGPTPPSSWTFGFFCLECHPPQHAHTHANTAICPHVCIQSHVYPYTPHVHTCPRAHMQPTDEHIHVCSHTHANVHTHTRTLLPWPFGPQPGACPPVGLRPPQRPPWAYPNPSSFLHIPGGSSSVTAGVAGPELGPGARAGSVGFGAVGRGGPG